MEKNLEKIAEELKRSEEKYRSMIELAPEDIVTVNLKGVLTSTNTAALKISGYSKEEVVGQHFTKLGVLQVKDIPKYVKIFKALLRGKVPEPLEVNLIHKDGTPRYAEVRVGVLKEKGKISGFQIMVADITKHKQMDEALRQSETRLLEAQRIAKLGNWELDVATGRGIWSAEMFHLTGFDPSAEAPSFPEFLECVHPEDRHIVESSMNAAQNGEFVTFDFRSNPARGPLRNFLVCVEPVRDAKSRVVRLIGTLQEITERKQTEEELVRLSNAVKMSTDSIVINDLEAKIIDVNEATLAMYGTDDKRDLIGKSSFDLIAPEDREKALAGMQEVLEKGYVKNREYHIVIKNGSRISVEMSVAIMQGADDKPIGFVGISRDITERKRLEEQFLQAQKMETIGQLAGGIAHDFNNFLTAIRGNTELLKQSIPLQEAERELVNEILKVSDEAAGLTRQLLTFSRRQPVKLVTLQINEVISNSEKMLRRILGETIELVILPRKEIGLVRADPAQIQQVLVNLAVNAKDAMPKGGKLTIETGNTYLDQEYAQGHPGVTPGEYIMIKVSDTGLGMSEEVKAHLFELFFSTKEIGKGTGLGLAVVYGIIKQHQGHITVSSEPGKGTTFHLYLPRIYEEKETTPEELKEPTLPKGKETILAVEDDASVRKFTTQALKRLGYTVLEASQPNEALEILKEKKDLKIDLLLSDVTMPQMSGKELAEKIKVNYPEIKIILMSGYAYEHLAEKDLVEKGYHFIEKPFTIETLAKKLREVVEQ